MDRALGFSDSGELKACVYCAPPAGDGVKLDSIVSRRLELTVTFASSSRLDGKANSGSGGLGSGAEAGGDGRGACYG